MLLRAQILHRTNTLPGVAITSRQQKHSEVTDIHLSHRSRGSPRHVPHLELPPTTAVVPFSLLIVHKQPDAILVKDHAPNVLRPLMHVRPMRPGERWSYVPTGPGSRSCILWVLGPQHQKFRSVNLLLLGHSTRVQLLRGLVDRARCCKSG